MEILDSILIVFMPLLLALFAYKKNLMTKYATVAAFVMAEIIGFCANIWWTIAFFCFPIVAFAATKWKLKEKMEKGLQEGKKGERHVMNLLGVGVIPSVIAIVYALDGANSEYLAIAFVSSLAVSVSDTIASETGIWAKKTYMITTLKQIEPGPNGGVSAYGFATSFIGTAVFSFVAWLLIYQEFDEGLLKFMIILVAGMFGNVMDSILGAVLENRGYIGKYSNNCSTSLLGAILGFLLALLF